MTLPRRSQRLRTAPKGQVVDQQGQQRKRKPTNEAPFPGTQEPVLKRCRLSERNLHKHQKAQTYKPDPWSMGKPRKTPTTSSKSTTSTITTTDKQFPCKLAQNRVVYESFDAEPPDDVKKLEDILLKERDVPIWAHGEWERMKIVKRQRAQNELDLESAVLESMLLQHRQDSPFHYSRFRNQQWTEVENEITAGISDPKPDVVEAYLWSAYPDDTPEYFEELVISQYPYGMPTFAMESKGPSGVPDQAVQQAAYDGAVMTHAAIAVDAQLNQSNLRFRNTKAITVTLSTSEISVYANHAVKGPEDKHIYYHQYEILSVKYVKNEAEWNRAHSILYNAQRIALDLANARIDGINKYFEAKKIRQDEHIAKQAELQQHAQAETRAAQKLMEAEATDVHDILPATQRPQTPESVNPRVGSSIPKK